MSPVLFLLVTFAACLRGYDAFSNISADYSPNRNVRLKRNDDNFLKEQPLTFKLKIVFDNEAVKQCITFPQLLCGKYTINYNVYRPAARFFEEAQVSETLNAMGGTLGKFISECFKSFQPDVSISCEVTTIVILKNPIPGLEDISKSPSNNYPRRTICGKSMLTKLQDYLTYSFHSDHTLFLTGYDLLDSHGHAGTVSFAYDNSICTKQSISLMEFHFDLNAFLRAAARAIMSSVGVHADPRFNGNQKESTYIMSHVPKKILEAEDNAMKYSPKSRERLHRFLELLPKKGRSQHCFTERLTPRLTPRVDIGARLSLDKQCRMAVNMPAAKHQVREYW